MISIHAALAEFLDEQRSTFSTNTFRNRESIMNYLLKHAIREGFDDLTDKHAQRLYEKVIRHGNEQNVEELLKAVEVGHLLDHVGMFLTYYMPRKMIIGETVERSAFPTLKKFIEFLTEHNYIDTETAEGAIQSIEDAKEDYRDIRAKRKRDAAKIRRMGY